MPNNCSITSQYSLVTFTPWLSANLTRERGRARGSQRAASLTIEQVGYAKARAEVVASTQALELELDRASWSKSYHRRSWVSTRWRLLA